MAKKIELKGPIMDNDTAWISVEKKRCSLHRLGNDR